MHGLYKRGDVRAHKEREIVERETHSHRACGVARQRKIWPPFHPDKDTATKVLWQCLEHPRAGVGRTITRRQNNYAANVNCDTENE